MVLGLVVAALAMLLSWQHSYAWSPSSPEPNQAQSMGPVPQYVADQVDIFLPLFQSVKNNSYCRFGVNLNTLGTAEEKDMDNYDISSLRLGWYINYSASPSYSSTKVEHAPMIRLKQTGANSYSFSPGQSQIQEIVVDNPGADWFISNEPDRKEFQDGIEPDTYATAYNELYYLIKGLDPSAQIFAGSIVQPTEVRLQYLDLILESYVEQFGEPMPVDGWSIHNFVLNEASCEHYEGNLSICWGADMPPAIDAVDGLRIGIDQHHDIELFKAQIIRFRNWMKENGYRDKPVYLSEYGVLLPDWYQPTVDFSPGRINQFMTESFDFLLNARDVQTGDPADDNRLVQRLSWYSVNDDYRSGAPYIYNGNLFSPATFKRSSMGDNYADYTAALSPEIDIAPISVSAMPTQTTNITTTPAISHTATITRTTYQSVILKAVVSNSGNLVDRSRAYVSFYDGNPLQGGQRIGEPQQIALTGCGDRVEVTMPWLDQPTGNYTIYVSVDDEDRLDETNEDNNLFSQNITTAPGTIILP